MMSQQDPRYLQQMNQRNQMNMQRNMAQGNPQGNNQERQDNLQARMSENDMQRKLERFKESRQLQSNIPHPQSFNPPPPMPVQVGLAHPVNNTAMRQQQPSYTQQQQQLESYPQYEPHPPHPQYHVQQQEQAQYQPLYQQQQQEQPQSPPHPPQAQQQLLQTAQQSKPKSNSTPLERITVSLGKANEVNKISLPYKNCEITSARILSVAVPLIDYNVDEKASCLMYSLNRLNAGAGVWQSLNIPIGQYNSRTRLLQAIQAELEGDNPGSEFRFHVNERSGICSLHAIHSADQIERDGFYFSTTHNELLYGPLGFKQKGKLDSERGVRGPDKTWKSSVQRKVQEWPEDMIPLEMTIEAEYEQLDYRHFEIESTVPMNLNPPAFLSLQIPELSDWRTTIFTANTEYGNYKSMELVDEDGIIDLESSSAFGGVVGLCQFTPVLTRLNSSTPYNTRDWPIHIALQLLVRRKS